MKYAGTLFFLIFIMTGVSGFAQSKTPECNEIEVSVEVNNPAGSSDGNVKVNLIKGDRSSVRYIFCNSKDGKVLNEGHFGQSELEGLKKGDYFCIVNTIDCSKKIDFKIE